MNLGISYKTGHTLRQLNMVYSKNNYYSYEVTHQLASYMFACADVHVCACVSVCVCVCTPV